MKGKATFTKAEADIIISLIKQKVLADAATQKKIRNKIRALGFYATDFGIGNGYTVDDFKRVVKIASTNSPKPVIKPELAKKATIQSNERKPSNTRANSDEAYVVGLCDAILKQKGMRQYRFDFLVGDAGTKLPVDSYYPNLNLVVEYCERQHKEDVKFFNRRQTVSGVNRGEQRKIYDQRRREILPKHGIKLIEFSFDEFEHDGRKRLKRSKEEDLDVIKKKLRKYLK